MLAQLRFQIEEEAGVGLDQVDYPSYFANLFEGFEGFLDDAEFPLIFNAYPSFVYSHGVFFCAANLFGASPLDRAPPPPPHDWSRQDELFTSRIPVSTAEILGQDDPVLPVGIDDVPAALADALQRTDTDTLGAWYIHLLFRPIANGAPLADAWDGDRVLFARHTATGAAGVLWTSIWDDELAATMVERALHTLHDGAGEPLVIERRGLRVVLARNFPADLTPALVEAAFAGASVSSLTKPLPLHLRNGGRRPHLPSHRG